MRKPEFLSRITNPEAEMEERLTVLGQFVLMNGLDGPVEMIPKSALPHGFVFRVKIMRDLLVCIAVSEREARENPTGAIPDSSQMWQFDLDFDHERVGPGAVICTFNGAMTKVVQVDDRAKAQAILNEWGEYPPDEAEILWGRPPEP